MYLLFMRKFNTKLHLLMIRIILCVHLFTLMFLCCLRIDNMRVDAQTLREIKESLQPMIDTSNFRSQFEETFGSLTDDELINSCPSRYTQTASEKMSYLKELAAMDKDAREKAAAAAKEQEEKDKVEKENQEFQSRLLEIFK